MSQRGWPENEYYHRLYAYECMCDVLEDEPQNYWVVPQIELVWESVQETYKSLPDKSNVHAPKKRHQCQ